MIYQTLKKGLKQENLLQVASSLSQWWKFGTHFWGSREGIKDGDHKGISDCPILAVPTNLVQSK